MKVGDKFSKSIQVTREMLASNVLEGAPSVFSTPSMLLLIEQTADSSIREHFKEGEASVGVGVDIVHSAPTPLGMRVTCDIELIDINLPMLTFSVSAKDEKGIVCTGSHSRAIVLAEKIIARAEKRKQSE